MDFFNKKKSVRDLKLPELPSAPEFPELPSEQSELPSLPQLPKLPAMPSFEKSEQPIARSFAVEIGEEKKTKPVFVKIDKFKEAMANFEMVKKKLQDSSSLLEKIKETRAKEEEELNQWSQELNSLKEKISTIDRKIFSNLD